MATSIPFLGVVDSHDDGADSFLGVVDSHDDAVDSFLDVVDSRDDGVDYVGDGVNLRAPIAGNNASVVNFCQKRGKRVVVRAP